MTLLFEIFGYLEVVLRGLAITAQALTVGGVLFLVCLVRPLAPALGPGPEIEARVMRLIAASAFSLAVVDVVASFVQVTVLADAMAIGFVEAAGAGFVAAAAVRFLAAIAIGVLALRRGSDWHTAVWLLLVVAVVAGSVARSHAVARIEDRWEPIVFGMLHQIGGALWLGGIPYFIVALGRLNDGQAWRLVGRRFSVMSMIAVAAIGLSGLGNGWMYFDGLQSIYGTAYGLMTGGKVIMFLGLLALGAMNYRVVERLRVDPATPIKRLRRFAEVEIAVGITIFFAAASLTSLPPAVDLPDDRPTFGEIVERLTPQWPRLVSPTRSETSIAQLQSRLNAEAQSAGTQAPRAYVPGAGLPKPRNAADLAWSEYNHNWAGVLLLVMGLFALAYHSGHAPWARHWPLLFLVLAVFLFWRSDPKYWPMGDINWFEGFRDTEAVQHRVVVLLIIAFALFEWGVRTGRLSRPVYSFVFPVGAAFGATILLTHSHALANVKEELLIEFTHTPLAILGVASAWARWLEIRLDRPGSRIAGWIWPICFVLIGFLLMTYRES